MNSLSTPMNIVNRKVASVKSKLLRIEYFLGTRAKAQNI